MKIERINTYQDLRFSQTVLNQHGCFLAEGEPYEVEIISEWEATVRGREVGLYPAIIEKFRFYTPHITLFYDEKHNIVQKFAPARLLTVPLKDIQPSQMWTKTRSRPSRILSGQGRTSSFRYCGREKQE